MSRVFGFVISASLLAIPLGAQEEPVSIPNWPAPPLWKFPDRKPIARAGTPATSPPRAGETPLAVLATTPTAPSPFVGITPCRVADTRGPAGPYGAPALAAATPRDFTMTGQCGIPVSAGAISLNITVTNTTGPGDIRIYPEGAATPLVSTLNYVAGQTVANAAIVPLGAGGGVTVVADVHGANLIIDTNGYYAAPSPGVTGDTVSPSSVFMTPCSDAIVAETLLDVAVPSRIYAVGSGSYSPYTTDLAGAYAFLRLWDQPAAIVLAVSEGQGSVRTGVSDVAFLQVSGFLKPSADPTAPPYVAAPGTYRLRLVVQSNDGNCSGGGAALCAAPILTYFVVPEP